MPPSDESLNFFSITFHNTTLKKKDNLNYHTSIAGITAIQSSALTRSSFVLLLPDQNENKTSWPYQNRAYSRIKKKRREKREIHLTALVS